MNELITMNGKKPVVDSTVIADGVHVEHAAVMKLLRKYLKDFETFGGVGFEIRPFETNGGTQKREVGVLSEDQAMLLFTFLKNTDIARQFKVRLIQAFKECRERLAKTSLALPNFGNPAEAARAWADQYEQRIALEKEKNALKLVVEEQKPKAAFADTIIASNDCYTMTEAAKIIGYPPGGMKDYLRKIGWLYAAKDTPMQTNIRNGTMVLRTHKFVHKNGAPDTKAYAHITSKGIYKLYTRMRDEGKIARNEKLELCAL